MKRKLNGFTLVEMLAVIIIIGLVAAFVGPRVFGEGDNARARLAKTQLVDVASKLELFKLDIGRYPTASEGIKSLVSNPGGINNWNGPYLQEAQIKDPWGTEIVYTTPGKSGPFELKSLGADLKEGGEGRDRDITL
jgi:general secretion pathway protein G